MPFFSCNHHFFKKTQLVDLKVFLRKKAKEMSKQLRKTKKEEGKTIVELLMKQKKRELDETVYTRETVFFGFMMGFNEVVEAVTVGIRSKWPEKSATG